jgi:hypothetical protein
MMLYYLLVEETKKRAWRDMIIDSNLPSAESINAVRPLVSNDSPWYLNGCCSTDVGVCGREARWKFLKVPGVTSCRINIPRCSFKPRVISARLATEYLVASHPRLLEL